MAKTQKSVADIRTLFAPLMGAVSEEHRVAFDQVCAMAEVHEKAQRVVGRLHAAFKTAFDEAQAELGGTRQAASSPASSKAASTDGAQAASPSNAHSRRRKRGSGRHATQEETQALTAKVLHVLTPVASLDHAAVIVPLGRSDIIQRAGLSPDEQRRLAYVLRKLRQENKISIRGAKFDAVYAFTPAPANAGAGLST